MRFFIHPHCYDLFLFVFAARDQLPSYLFYVFFKGGYYDGVWSELAGGVAGDDNHVGPYEVEVFGDRAYIYGDFDRVGVNQFANNIAAYAIIIYSLFLPTSHTHARIHSTLTPTPTP